MLFGSSWAKCVTSGLRVMIVVGSCRRERAASWVVSGVGWGEGDVGGEEG